MQNEQIFNSVYTGEEMDNAFSVALAIANHNGIPKGTGSGSIQILGVDNNSLTRDGERIPTSAAVAKAIAEARKVSELLTFKGVVQTTDDLPADAKPGFVYIVEQEDNENYAWDGASWTPIGQLIAPIVMVSQTVSYQLSDSGEVSPSGEWLTEFPGVQKGKYLWTRVVVQFSVGEPITSYSCAYNGDDGSGAVSTVCGIGPDSDANINLTAENVSALPTSGGDITGEIRMNGQPISGLNAPTEDTQAANKGYVDSRTDLVLQSGAGLHNSIYRGKNIQDKYNDGSLWAAISSGTFEDLYIGDYFDITISTSFTASETVRCLLAGFDVYYKCGDSPLNTHHAVIVPMNCFAATAAMNSSNDTTGAYYGSAMHNNVLPVYSSAIKNVLGSHLLTHRELLTNSVSTTVSSMAGAGFTGASSGCAWYDCTLRLMSEPEVFGNTAMSSSFHDIGFAKTQLPLFRLRPDKIICGMGGSGYANEISRSTWWLSAVCSSTHFSFVFYYGSATNGGASYSNGVRPRFLIS